MDYIDRSTLCGRRIEHWIVLCCLLLAITWSAGTAFSSIERRKSPIPFSTAKQLYQQKHYQGWTKRYAATDVDSSEELLADISTDAADASAIMDKIRDFERAFEWPPDTNSSRFDAIVGLYNVSFTKPARDGDSPAGGKWTRQNGLVQKLLRTRRLLQHILPVNSTGIGALQRENRSVVGEAINMVTLEALGGFVRVNVILRGDAVALNTTERSNVTRFVQPLTTLAVKALFDPPRIAIGRRGRWINFNLGPRSGVFLDTTHVDNVMRIGMGSSGTRFVFARCSDNDAEAGDFQSILSHKPLSKAKSISVLGSAAALGLYLFLQKLRVLGGVIAVGSTLLTALISTSSGGIDRDSPGRRNA